MWSLIAWLATCASSYKNFSVQRIYSTEKINQSEWLEESHDFFGKLDYFDFSEVYSDGWRNL